MRKDNEIIKSKFHRTLYLPVAVLLVLTIGLELLSINLSQKVSSESTVVKELQESIALLDEENHILNTKLLKQTSFDEISRKATSIGFVEDAEYILLQEPKFTFSR